MKTEAVKFTDLEAFLETMRAQGLGQEAERLVYEQGRLPYRSAFLVPVSLFPAAFDWQTVGEFGGVITQVREFEFTGTERFTTNFMVYPLSGIGYLETGNYPDIIPSTNGHSANGEETDMAFVINLVDGIGREFYLSESDKMVPLDQPSDDAPKVLRVHKRVQKIIQDLNPNYSATCRLYAVERKEFEKRRQLLQNPPQAKGKKKM